MNPGVALVTGVVGLVVGVGIGWWLPRGVEDPAGEQSREVKAVGAAGVGVEALEPEGGYPGMVGRGEVSAGGGVAAALAELEGVEAGSERRAFLRGMFGRLAATMRACEVLAVASGLDGADWRTALWAKVAAWTDGRVDENSMAGEWVKRFGVEAGLAMGLAYDEVFSAETGEAWAEEFGDSSGAGALLGTFAAVRVAEDFDGAMRFGE